MEPENPFDGGPGSPLSTNQNAPETSGEELHDDIPTDPGAFAHELRANGAAAAQGKFSVDAAGFPQVSPAPGPIGRIDGFEEVHSPPQLNHGEPQTLYLDDLDVDASFRIRDEGEVALLATDIARLGQLFPIDVRPSKQAGRYQIVCGFRRVAALLFLHREKVLARVHPNLSDEDALVMALTTAIHASPITAEDLQKTRDRLESQGRLSAATRDMLEKALLPEGSLSPEGVEEEIDADELAGDVTMRMADLNQDLALLADVFGSLEESRKAELLQQLRYAETLVNYLEKV
jgi:ParB family transcriptional regulator, chromosome partitioning protein